MKYNKILSITLANALFLLMFASLLASCQKNSLNYSGHFTDYPLKTRSIASTAMDITKHMDPKQIVIYCKINSVNNEQCFRQFFNEKMLELQQNNKLQNIQNISYKDYFIKATKDVENITKSILSTVEPKLDKHVKNRHDFCARNAKFHLKKCIYNSTESDSMIILNNYQQKVSRLNAQEYLYLKYHITNNMNQKLTVSFNQLKSSPN